MLPDNFVLLVNAIGLAFACIQLITIGSIKLSQRRRASNAGANDAAAPSQRALVGGEEQSVDIIVAPPVSGDSGVKSVPAPPLGALASLTEPLQDGGPAKATDANA